MDKIFAIFFDKLRVSSPKAYAAFAAILIGLNAALASGYIETDSNFTNVITIIISTAIAAITSSRTKRHMDYVSTLSNKDLDD